jgi:hypothetical protein
MYRIYELSSLKKVVSTFEKKNLCLVKQRKFNQTHNCVNEIVSFFFCLNIHLRPLQLSPLGILGGGLFFPQGTLIFPSILRQIHLLDISRRTNFFCLKLKPLSANSSVFPPFPLNRTDLLGFLAFQVSPLGRTK